jgi:hypothetical protein
VNELLGREKGDRRTSWALYELARTGYLETRHQSDNEIGPSYVALTEKSFRGLAGWPGENADLAAIALVELIQHRVDDAGTDEERSRWIRLRDGVIGMGHEVIVELLSTLAQTGVHKIPM